MPEDKLQYPKSNDQEGALRYLIEARDHVSSQEAPPDHIQVTHSKGAPVGDGKSSAITNATYQMRQGSRALASIAYPDSTSQVNGHPVVPDERGNLQLTKANGFSPQALSESYRQLLVSQGLHPRKGKIGHDQLSGTSYVEYDLPPEEYEKAHRITEAYVHGKPGETPEQMLTRIKASYADLPEPVPALHRGTPPAEENTKTPVKSQPSEEPPHSSGKRSGAMSEPHEHGPGGAAVGLALGTVGFSEALKHNDKLGELTSGANVILSAKELTLILQSAKQLTPAMKQSLEDLGTKNAYVTMADGVLQVYDEDTFKHKMQRVGAVGAATGITTGAAGVMVAAATEGGELGSAGGPVGTAIGVTAGAVGGGSYALINEGIAISREWESAYKSIDGIQADLKHHSNLHVEEKSMHAELDKLHVTRDVNGRVDLSNVENVEKLREAMREHRIELEKVIKGNSTSLPTWMDITEGQSNRRGAKFAAEAELKRLTEAGVELGDELQKEGKAQQPSPHSAQQQALNAVRSNPAPIAYDGDHAAYVLPTQGAVVKGTDSRSLPA